MMVFLNGRLVPAEQATVSVFDRGFLFGDSVFETVRIYRGTPFRWAAHLDRLEAGAKHLRLHLPFDRAALTRQLAELVAVERQPEAVLRLTVSRGVGPRGYSTKGANSPTTVLSLHPAPVIDPAQPPVWRLLTSSVRVSSHDPLPHFKTGNKLPHILARTDADEAGVDDVLILNERGEITEASSSNVFWISHGTVCTPPIATGALPGVTRSVVQQLCEELALPWQETNLAPTDLTKTEGVFLGQSVWEIVAATELDGHPLPQSPLVGRLQAAYRDAVHRECP